VVLVGSTAALFLERVPFGPNTVVLVGSTVALFLERVPFGPNTVVLVGALLLRIWKGCSLDQKLWLYWVHCCFVFGRGAVQVLAHRSTVINECFCTLSLQVNYCTSSQVMGLVPQSVSQFVIIG
jgi:hypothetical protein